MCFCTEGSGATSEVLVVVTVTVVVIESPDGETAYAFAAERGVVIVVCATAADVGSVGTTPLVALVSATLAGLTFSAGLSPNFFLEAAHAAICNYHGKQRYEIFP